MKKNPQDATTRNVTASEKRDALLARRIKAQETALAALESSHDMLTSIVESLRVRLYHLETRYERLEPTAGGITPLGSLK